MKKTIHSYNNSSSIDKYSDEEFIVDVESANSKYSKECSLITWFKFDFIRTG